MHHNIFLYISSCSLLHRWGSSSAYISLVSTNHWLRIDNLITLTTYVQSHFSCFPTFLLAICYIHEAYKYLLHDLSSAILVWLAPVMNWVDYLIGHFFVCFWFTNLIGHLNYSKLQIVTFSNALSSVSLYDWDVESGKCIVICSAGCRIHGFRPDLGRQRNVLIGSFK